MTQAPTIQRLTDTIGVAAQISPDDLPAIAAQGYRSVVNNRPDGEEPGQPADAALAAAAARAGLAYRPLPVVSGQVRDDQARAFAQAIAELPAPVLAFCRTGTRSTMLWALQATDALDDRAILARAASAGYDLAAFAPRLRAYRGQ
ncbi:TIGR01244 family sulfur transferase [Dyella sp.]|jgi:sulfide:quinone oxidoreductase|uniref:TIGR01244 family sulfur transferase n=1 Tax=Dyella sp. TaxID=1869338 RepID=UPI002D797230|nr:TIGR01244 family sulfur transferase [Dyella sp.]HET6434027.1 TIGR01244 family sulfur transferase [Dyella sp.]